MRKNQKGFTLVELIIAVAILAIVTLAVCGFIVVGSRSYTSANTDIMLQQEAQLALNQISDVIIDTTDSINYGNGTDLVLKDSEFSGEPDQKILVVVNKKDGNNDNDSYRFEWSKDTETIYFNTSDTVIDDANPEPVFDDANRAILAQHVRELHIDISQFEENRVVMISMTFENGNREYTTSNNVTVRNRVALNKIDIDPMKKAEEFTITTVKSVVLEPNDTYSLPFTVDSTAADEDAKDVKWEMVGGPMNGSSISEDGRLTIGREEKRESFTVRVYRVKEEYANQNDKVAKTVKVRIKRANTVNLSCSATTIKAGSTVTVNGSAAGYLLGSQCNGEGCATDDLTKDHDLVTAISAEGWRIVQGPATVETADSGKAEIKILSTAKKGDTIEIEARASLPDRKGYGPVTGRLTLKVTEGNDGAKFIGSDLKYGTDNDPGIFDYMRQGLETDFGSYVVCMRAREEGVTTAANDRVVLYHSTAANVRFTPDVFGFDLEKTYYVYFQILDPVSWETRQAKAENKIGSLFKDDDATIAAEYLGVGNVDDTGKYVGDKYPAGELFYGVVRPPQISITHSKSGITYPTEDPNFYESYSLIADKDAMIKTLGLGEILNIEENLARSSIKFSVYRGDGNDPSQWEPLYIYQEKNGQVVAEGNRQINNGTFYIEGTTIGNDNFVKRNKMDQYDQQDCGMYHIVPGFEFQNNPTRNREYEFIIPPDRDGWDFDLHYYNRFECSINVKVDTGLNLQLPNENNEERWTIFPLPSDMAFPFERENREEQKIIRNFDIYSPTNGQSKGNMNNATVTCKYAGNDIYVITISSIQIEGRTIKTHIYGQYMADQKSDIWQLQPNSEKWIEENVETNLTFRKDGGTWDTYFPTPNDAEFPSDAFINGQTLENWQLIEFNKQNAWQNNVERADVKCSMENGDYHIEIIVEYNTWTPHKVIRYNYGDFVWSRTEKLWRLTSQETDQGEEVGVWGTLIYFKHEGQDCKMEMPLPTEKGFPIFSESYSENGNVQYFDKSDEFGEYTKTMYNVTKIYRYDLGTKQYTFEIKDQYSDRIFHKWTCSKNGAEWTWVNVY